MKSKSSRLVRRNHARYHSGRDDLNIVPMIDMMVILVFFLIFTAVFSKTSILPLNLPASAASAAPPLPPGFKLQVTVHPGDIVISDRNGNDGNAGLPKTLANTADGYDLHALSQFMREFKSQYPDMTDATVLLGPHIPYDALVQVMDAVRVYQLPVQPFTKAELFPDISLGDAP
jgi:biopolymer transport protein ExbD